MLKEIGDQRLTLIPTDIPDLIQIDRELANKLSNIELQTQTTQDNDLLMLTLFYKPEENSLLFTLYKTICDETQNLQSSGKQAYFTYNDLCRKINS